MKFRRIVLSAFVLAIASSPLSASAGGGGTTYYAALKAQVSGGSSGRGLVYAGTSKTAPSASSYSESSTSSNQSDSTKDTAKTFYAFAKPASEAYEFAGWSTTDGGDVVSTDNPYAVTVKCSSDSNSSPTTSTVYANFGLRTLPEFSVVFAPGAYTANGSEPRDMEGLVQATRITLESSDGSFFAWMIGGKEIFDNPYTADYLEDTEISAVFLSPENVAAVDTPEALSSALSDASLRKISVPSGTEVAIAAGETAVVPEGKMLSVDGTLYVEGTLEVKGQVVANGTVSRCSTVFTQTGDGGEPFAPYGAVRYWKTSQEASSAKVTGFSASKTHVTVVNGHGETFRRVRTNTSSTMLKCNVDSSVAVNHVTGIADGEWTSIETATNKGSPTAGTMILLLGNVTDDCSTTQNNGAKKLAVNRGVLDCAGKTYTIPSSSFTTGSGYVHTILNGNATCSATTAYGGFYGKWTCINCSVKIANLVNKTGGCTVDIYDCTPGQWITRMETAGNTTAKVRCYSGGPYDPSTFVKSTNQTPGCFEIYGGFWTSEPDTGLNALSGTHKFYQHSDGYWYLEEIRDADVARIGETQFDTFSGAFAAAVDAGSATIELLQNCEVDSRLEIPEGASIRLELNGCVLSSAAAEGLFLNNGSLEIGDGNSRLADSGLSAASGYVVENNGTAKIAYGVYSGDIRLDAGTFSTYHGIFDGALSVADGVAPADVADLRGGEFKESVEAFLCDGVSQVKSGNRYWVGSFPYAVVSGTNLSSAEKAWQLSLLSAADKALYLNGSSSRADYSDADWYRRAELASSIAPYGNYVLECALAFDRDVSAGSVSFKGNAGLAITQDLDADLAADEFYGVLLKNMTAPKAYVLAINEVPTVTAGLKNNATGNVGTVGTVELWLATTSGWRKAYALASCRYMLGGKKAAIDRDGGRAAYDSLAEAVADARDGERVLVGADTAENVTLPAMAGVYVVDPYGFVFTGEVSAPEGFELESAEEVDSAVKGVESAPAVAYVLKAAGGDGKGGGDGPGSETSLEAPVASALRVVKRDGAAVLVVTVGNPKAGAWYRLVDSADKTPLSAAPVPAASAETVVVEAPLDESKPVLKFLVEATDDASGFAD